MTARTESSLHSLLRSLLRSLRSRPLARGWLLPCALGLSALAHGCNESIAANDEPLPEDSAKLDKQVAKLSAMIGSEGGELIGKANGPFAGVKLVIPAGALERETEIAIVPADESDKPLPETAVPCGPMFQIEPSGLALASPAMMTVPFERAVIEDHYRFDDDVKVWVGTEEGWGRELQVDNQDGHVSFELGALTRVAAGINPPKAEDISSFAFEPIASQLPCIAQYPDDPKRQPQVDVVVVRGDDNDAMLVRGRYIKPGLGFDLFSLERSTLAADGQRDPNFRGFGLAWYQTNLTASRWGRIHTVVRTVLLNQAFGLDGDVMLPATRTLHLGFWFDQPADAAACGFDPTRTTPFNGTQTAGPLAMISLPDADTGLGPLCTKPDTSVTPAVCLK